MVQTRMEATELLRTVNDQTLISGHIESERTVAKDISWATGWRCGFIVCFLYTTPQVICLLIFLNWHVQYVYLRRKWKSSCFNSCLVIRERDESSGMQHFHEISNTIPGLYATIRDSILTKNPESLPKKCSHIVNIGLKLNKCLKEVRKGVGREEI